MRDTETLNGEPFIPGRVIVTGAASGIGRATATCLLLEGWKVVALDRDALALEQLRLEHGNAAGLSVEAVDITHTDEMHKPPQRTLLVRYVRASGHRIAALADLGRDCLHRLNSR